MAASKETFDQYDQLNQQLEVVNASIRASEVHGFICGVIATDQKVPADWFTELFDQSEEGDLLVKDCRTSIKQLYTETLEEIEGAGLGMQLMLPNDSYSIAERAKAVSQWCQGFLYGIGFTGKAGHHLSDQAREALEDIAAFTRIDVDALEEDTDNDDEDALTEIIEFIWVAAMLVRESYIADEIESENKSHEYH